MGIGTLPGRRFSRVGITATRRGSTAEAAETSSVGGEVVTFSSENPPTLAIIHIVDGIGDDTGGFECKLELHLFFFPLVLDRW